MILGKALILKGLAGVATIGGAVTVGLGIKNNWWQKPVPAAQTLTDADLIAKVGLDCGTPSSNGTDCTKKDGHGNISVKQGTTTFEVSTITGGKIKLYKLEDSNTGYKNNLKFAIEEGDINGTTNSNKLEQFETYEIEEVTETSGTKKYYLKRKSDAKEGIRVALGLPNTCNLPENTNENNGSNCPSISSDDLKTINFDGKKEGGSTIDSGGNATINITKVSDTNYPFGYKFTIQPTQKLTISTSPENSIAPNVGVEFKIKKTSGTNQISLEKAWTLQTLAAKVGLENCNDSNECSIKTDGINVKHDDTKEDSKTKSTSSSGGTQGKIKVYKDTSNHKEGFKFVIEDGDITLSTGTISKLEQFETYEIEESGGKYYLSRKNKAFKEISKSLGLPDGCDELTDNTKDCSNLTKDKLKGINFEGKSNGEVTIENDSGSNIKLKVTKLTTSDTAFPNGYKFVLESDKKITIPKSSGSIIINKNTNTEFKIKVSSSNGTKTLTLEKAWTAKTLGEKVGLVCEESNSEKKCTFTDGKINVKNDSDKIEGAKLKNSGDASSKKMTYEEDKEGYNQGIKFYLDESDDLSLTKDTGDDGSGDKKICKKSGDSGTETYYEIKKDESDSKWYLTKKTTTGSSS